MSNIRILVADDHSLVRSTIAGYLGSLEGVEVIGEASTGAEAVATALRMSPDLVLLDVHMPSENGCTAARRIKAGVPGTRVVLMSASQGRIYEDQALLCEADAFIRKSSLRNDLRALIGTFRALSPHHPSPAIA